MAETNSREKDTGGGVARVERMFSRLGMVAASLLLLLLVLVLDVFVIGREGPAGDSDSTTFAVALYTPDGRLVSGRADTRGVQLVVSPMSAYENRPGQEHYEVNSSGFRGPELDPSAGRPRVVVIGGSGAFGEGVREKDTFSAVLRRRHPELEIVNAGVVGFVSHQELGFVVERILDLRPALIVAFNGWNNVYDPYWVSIFYGVDLESYDVSASYIDKVDRLATYRELVEEPWAAVAQAGRTIIDSSILLSTLSGLAGSDPGPSEFPGFGDEWRATVERGYVGDMLKVRDLARALDCGFVVLVQPEHGQFRGRVLPEMIAGDRYAEVFSPMYRDFRRNVARTLAADGVDVIDVTEPLLRVDGRGDALFVDPVHLNPAGHQAVANLLDDRLGRLLSEHDEP